MRHPTAETGDQREQGEHDLDDELAPASVDAAVQAFGSVTDELLAAIARDPKILYRLHWRQFEELVAELLDRQGFDVTLTPPSRDGGIDIYARRVEPLGSSLYVVECKRYGPEQPIGPDLVRTLYGVVERVRATRGILATTSFFTLGARKEAAGDLAYRITLRDGSDITRWIRRGPDGQVRG
jgi:restriction system protein